MVQVSLGDLQNCSRHPEKQRKTGGALCNDSSKSFPVLPYIQANHRVQETVRHSQEPSGQLEQVSPPPQRSVPATPLLHLRTVLHDALCIIVQCFAKRCWGFADPHAF